MKAKIFRMLRVMGFLLAAGSLSACFVGPYDPPDPAYSYGPHAYAYPEYYPHRAPGYVPAPRYYAYNQHPHWQHRRQKEHKERDEHRQRDRF
jgi:hypothetical protein